MAAKMFGRFLQSLANKEVDLDSDTIKAMLVTSAWTPDQDAHRYKSDVTGEASGTGYTAGGQALTDVTVGYDAATNTLTLDSADPSWANSSITARYIVFYDDTPSTAATKPLISYDDFGADKVSANGAFTYQVNAAGIVTITAA